MRVELRGAATARVITVYLSRVPCAGEVIDVEDVTGARVKTSVVLAVVHLAKRTSFIDPSSETTLVNVLMTEL